LKKSIDKRNIPCYTIQAPNKSRTSSKGCDRKKVFKELEKVLDKRKTMWYTERVAAKRRGQKPNRKKVLKKIEKVLDKTKKMW